jgi:hypothetical protein
MLIRRMRLLKKKHQEQNLLLQLEIARPNNQSIHNHLVHLYHHLKAIHMCVLNANWLIISHLNSDISAIFIHHGASRS